MTELLGINLSQYQKSSWMYFPKSMWVFVNEKDKSSVCHLEIVEIEIITALILIVFEVFSDSVMRRLTFFLSISISKLQTH